MSEVTRTIWLLSNPICSKYRMKMEENLGVIFKNSEQHKTCMKSRVNRDHSDSAKIYDVLKTDSPFSNNNCLRNIINGITADKAVNVDRFYEIGQEHIKNMQGYDIFTYECSRKAAAKNMTAKISLDKKKNIKCDPALLFQRLLLVAQTNPIDMDDILSYELSAFPLSLFETSTLLRKANKPNLTEGIVKIINATCESMNESILIEVDANQDSTDRSIIQKDLPDQQNIQYVLDGGSLLHRISWTKGKSYGEIASSCCNFVLSRYNQAIVDFDGYDMRPSTKDMTHLRRSEKHSPREVFFSEDTIVCLSKEDFLSHSQNKAKFAYLIGEKLKQVGCRVVHSTDDADRDIAVTSVHESLTKDVTVIGEDTDLLILMLYCETGGYGRGRVYGGSDIENCQNQVIQFFE